MSQDDAQTIREREALAKVRAHLDREERDQPIRSWREAAAHMVTTLPMTIAIFVLVVATIVAGVLLHRRSIALPVPTSRAEYLTNVFAKAQRSANTQNTRVHDGLRGRVEVAFRVRPDGKVEGVEVPQPSYDARIDNAAVMLVSVAAPYGPFPAGVGTEPLPVKGTWQFDDGRATFVPR